MEADWWARATATAGVVMAGWSLWQNHRKSALRLKILPIISPAVGSTNAYLEAIRIVNRSDFAVNIAEVGVFKKDNKKIIVPATFSHAPMLVIGARSSVVVKSTTHVVAFSAIGDLKQCYLETADGRTLKARIRIPHPIKLTK
jgi:hypothetical protein